MKIRCCLPLLMCMMAAPAMAQLGAITRAAGAARPAAVQAGDVLFGFDPALGLKGQKVAIGYEAVGVNTLSSTSPASIDYQGDARISLVPDPTDPKRQVLRLKQRPDDPIIAGQPRTELNFHRGKESTAPPRDSWFWRAWQVYLPAWAETDAPYIVAQIHSTGGRNPPVAMAIRSGRYTIDVRSATKVPMTPSDQVNRLVRKDLGPIVVGKWTTIVHRVRIDPEGGGLAIWIDGNQVLDYNGPLGYADGEHYIKQGMYPLDSKVGQEMLLRGPWLIRDSNYEEPVVRAWVAQQR